MMLFPQHFLLRFFWYHLKEVGYLREGKEGHRRNEGPARAWLVIRCSDLRRRSLGNIWFYYLAGSIMANLRLINNLFDLFFMEHASKWNVSRSVFGSLSRYIKNLPASWSLTPIIVIPNRYLLYNLFFWG